MDSSTAAKSRSCIVCRNRKVRCDKQSPCSNCRRANISCVFPSTDRPPRWVRRLDRLTEDPSRVSSPASQNAGPTFADAMDRLHSLEHLVRELRGQLEHAQSTAAPSNPGSRLVPSPAPSSTGRGLGDHVSSSSTRQDPSDAPSPPGRLVLQEGETQSHYVGSAFWSRIVDEVS